MGAGASVAQLRAVARRARRAARRRLNRTAATIGFHDHGARYLNASAAPRLHLGCGGNLLGGWLNMDRDPPAGGMYADVTRRLPLPSESFERVFSEHLIEHVDWIDGAGMLRECHRVLRPRGRIRIGTPDLLRVVGLFDAEHDDAARRYMDEYAKAFLPPGASGPAFVANQAFRGWGHRFLYDEDTLAAALQAAGFAEVRRFGWGETDDPAFRGVEAAGDEFTASTRAYETLCLEATRRP